jgi:prevent-host-death family protein
MEVPIREMKNRLSQYLKLVQSGGEVVITDRGRPVARLTPFAPSTAQTEAEAIRQIESLPWVRPGAGGKVRGLQRGVRLRGEGPNASEIVLPDRD